MVPRNTHLNARRLRPQKCHVAPPQFDIPHRLGYVSEWQPGIHILSLHRSQEILQKSLEALQNCVNRRNWSNWKKLLRKKEIREMNWVTNKSMKCLMLSQRTVIPSPQTMQILDWPI